MAHRPYNASTEPLYAKFRINNILDMFKFLLVKIMYKYHDGELPTSLNELFISNSSVHTYTIRNKEATHLFTNCSSRHMKSFMYLAPKLWLKIPVGERNAKVVKTIEKR